MSNTEVVRSYISAWNTHDPEAAAAHFADDGVRHWQVVMSPLIGGPTRFEGHDEIAGGIKAFMDAVPDLVVERRQLLDRRRLLERAAGPDRTVGCRDYSGRRGGRGRRDQAGLGDVQRVGAADHRLHAR